MRHQGKTLWLVVCPSIHVQGFIQGGWDTPRQSYFPTPPPPQEFSQPNYSRMFYACANYFRMAISTSRMPQNQSQSIYFSKFSGGGGGHATRPP